MARFALRNQKKISDAYGEPFLICLLQSLTVHFKNNPEIKTETEYTNEPYPVIHVQNSQARTDSTFELYVIRVVYDVYNLAYKGVMS